MANENLGSNEQAVLAAASRIFSGLAATAIKSKSSYATAYKFSLRTAVQMAEAINKSSRVENVAEGEVPFPL